MGIKIGPANLMEHARLVRSWLWRWEDNTTFAPGAMTSDPILGEDIRGALFWDQGGTGEADALMAAIKNASDAMAYAEVLTTASGATRPYATVFNVKDYGAKGDGTTNDRGAINAAITTCSAAGGGVVYLPEGTYRVGNNAGPTAISLSGNVHLMGAGRGATVIELMDDSNDHVIEVSGNNWAITDLTVDGRRADQDSLGSQTHGIRGDGQYWRIENIEVRNAFWYGIGLGQERDTALIGTVRNVFVFNTGSDGIDTKEHSNGTTKNDLVVFENIRVENYDQLGAGGKAGLDLRGPFRVSHVTVLANDVMGTESPAIRYRDASHALHISNFRCIGPGTGEVTNSVGLQLQSYAKVTNGSVEGFEHGVWKNDTTSIYHHMSVVNVDVLDCTNGFYFEAGEAGLTNCLAEGCVYGFLIAGNYVTLTNPVAKDCTTNAIRITASAIGSKVIGGRATGTTYTDGIFINTGPTLARIWGFDLTDCTASDKKIDNTATGTVIQECPGYVTRNAGVTSVADGGTISHGLVAAPTKYGATTTTADEYVAVTAVSSTTMTVALTKHDGTAGTTANVAWWAEV